MMKRNEYENLKKAHALYEELKLHYDKFNSNIDKSYNYSLFVSKSFELIKLGIANPFMINGIVVEDEVEETPKKEEPKQEEHKEEVQVDKEEKKVVEPVYQHGYNRFANAHKK